MFKATPWVSFPSDWDEPTHFKRLWVLSFGEKIHSGDPAALVRKTEEGQWSWEVYPPVGRLNQPIFEGVVATREEAKQKCDRLLAEYFEGCLPKEQSDVKSDLTRFKELRTLFHDVKKYLGPWQETVPGERWARCNVYGMTMIVCNRADYKKGHLVDLTSPWVVFDQRDLRAMSHIQTESAEEAMRLADENLNQRGFALINEE